MEVDQVAVELRRDYASALQRIAEEIDMEVTVDDYGHGVVTSLREVTPEYLGRTSVSS